MAYAAALHGGYAYAAGTGSHSDTPFGNGPAVRASVQGHGQRRRPLTLDDARQDGADLREHRSFIGRQHRLADDLALHRVRDLPDRSLQSDLGRCSHGPDLRVLPYLL